jgi:hypothetical protein
LIAFQKSVAQTILYEHHRATFKRQKQIGKSFLGEDRNNKAEKGFSQENQVNQKKSFSQFLPPLFQRSLKHRLEKSKNFFVW